MLRVEIPVMLIRVAQAGIVELTTALPALSARNSVPVRMMFCIAPQLKRSGDIERPSVTLVSLSVMLLASVLSTAMGVAAFTVAGRKSAIANVKNWSVRRLGSRAIAHS